MLHEAHHDERERFSVDDYVYTVEKLDGEGDIGWFEVNISCPNVHGGGMAFGTSAENAAKVTEAVRKATKKPIIIKLSPNVTDITEIAKACEAAGADGISLINTLFGMKIDLKRRRPVLANKARRIFGTCGKAGCGENGISGVRGGKNIDSRNGQAFLLLRT